MTWREDFGEMAEREKRWDRAYRDTEVNELSPDILTHADEDRRALRLFAEELLNLRQLGQFDDEEIDRLWAEAKQKAGAEG